MNDISAGHLALLILLGLGTIARLTRLITKDSITQPIRDRIERRMVRAEMRGVWNKIDDLVNCPWCVSIWVGFPAGFIATWHYSNRIVLASMIGLTASWIAANVQVREPSDEPERIIVMDDEDSSET